LAISQPQAEALEALSALPRQAEALAALVAEPLVDSEHPRQLEALVVARTVALAPPAALVQAEAEVLEERLPLADSGAPRVDLVREAEDSVRSLQAPLVVRWEALDSVVVVAGLEPLEELQGLEAPLEALEPQAGLLVDLELLQQEAQEDLVLPLVLEHLEVNLALLEEVLVAVEELEELPQDLVRDLEQSQEAQDLVARLEEVLVLLEDLVVLPLVVVSVLLPILRLEELLEENRMVDSLLEAPWVVRLGR
jgi:hypothetical protein